MRRYLAAVFIVGVALLALSQGFGKPKQVSADPGVSTVSITGVICTGPDTMNVAISWPTLNQGTQFIYWSLQNNGWLPGTYIAHGPFAAGASAAIVTGVPEASAIYVMVGTVIGGVLDPGQTMVFSTLDLCAGAMQQGGNEATFTFQQCDPVLIATARQFIVVDDEDDFDDEDEDQDEDEDENDFDEDEDDGDDFDEDEDEDDESFDEDEEDEDHVTVVVRRFGIPAHCIPLLGRQVVFIR
jgi:hypothetical protein